MLSTDNHPYEEIFCHIFSFEACLEKLFSDRLLGRLHCTEAIPSLTEISKTYWYPPVREAAEKAIRAITQRSKNESPNNQSDFEPEFFDYMFGISCSYKYTEDFGENNDRSSTHGDYIDSDELKKLVYKYNLSFFLLDAAELETEEKLPGVVGVRVSNGYLVGSYRGEWGGKLVFIDSKGKQTILLNDNVTDIHKLGTHIVAVTGLAHWGSNKGILYKVFNIGDGGWQASKWKALPGAPVRSKLSENGNLLVDCYGGGIVEILSNGEMKMVER